MELSQIQMSSPETGNGFFSSPICSWWQKCFFCFPGVVRETGPRTLFRALRGGLKGVPLMVRRGPFLGLWCVGSCPRPAAAQSPPGDCGQYVPRNVGAVLFAQCGALGCPAANEGKGLCSTLPGYYARRPVETGDRWAGWRKATCTVGGRPFGHFDHSQAAGPFFLGDCSLCRQSKENNLDPALVLPPPGRSPESSCTPVSGVPLPSVCTPCVPRIVCPPPVRGEDPCTAVPVVLCTAVR